MKKKKKKKKKKKRKRKSIWSIKNPNIKRNAKAFYSFLRWIQIFFFSFIKVILGISSLYDDNDVCEKVDCNFIKRLQFTSIQVVKEGKYYSWSEYFRNKVYEFLYGNKTTSEIL